MVRLEEEVRNSIVIEYINFLEFLHTRRTRRNEEEQNNRPRSISRIVRLIFLNGNFDDSIEILAWWNRIYARLQIRLNFADDKTEE